MPDIPFLDSVVSVISALDTTMVANRLEKNQRNCLLISIRTGQELNRLINRFKSNHYVTAMQVTHIPPSHSAEPSSASVLEGVCFLTTTLSVPLGRASRKPTWISVTRVSFQAQA